ncbi:hypothetical protein H1V43_32025 [Streptomyces sp. PSKA54]|uniref:Uncharacterized protein n=1 Tax=Streptomyces himalayensis subsp. aureolus TaxID=2758039 RepID=A0A7W2D6X9_9ACTN|nr:hypothetical protein [Streptomyces himalayensis]MBA4865893.1 hypothetical protein [Streptomyces himalayensis subsp. aureolus]
MEKCPRCATASLADPENGLPWCAQCGRFFGLSLPSCRGLWWWRNAPTRTPARLREH